VWHGFLGHDVSRRQRRRTRTIQGHGAFREWIEGARRCLEGRRSHVLLRLVVRRFLLNGARGGVHRRGGNRSACAGGERALSAGLVPCDRWRMVRRRSLCFRLADPHGRLRRVSSFPRKKGCDEGAAQSRANRKQRRKRPAIPQGFCDERIAHDRANVLARLSLQQVVLLITSTHNTATRRAVWQCSRVEGSTSP
jgi:hypothetical protein